MILKNENTYAQCAILETYSSNPVPVAGNAYPTSTTVTFCYSLNGFWQNGGNYVDGFIITLGSGWDAASLTPVLTPNSCDGGGQWGFYQSVTSSATGGVFGPGFFYDRYDPITFQYNNNPGDDWGDFSVTGTCEWDLCFSVTVNSTCTSSDLSVSVTAAGDGTVGNWLFPDCPGIPFSLSTATCVAYCTGFSVDASGINPNCLANNGSVSSQVTAGTQPFSYQWSNPGGVTSSMNSLTPGTYIITVTDVNSCVCIDSISLVLPSSFTMTSVVNNATCLSYCNGSISLTTIGGLPPFTYQWSNALAPISNPGNLCTGTYFVTVTDANLCTVSGSYFVSEPAGMNINMLPTATTCPGSCDGSMTSVVSLGTPPYSLLWFNNSTSNIISGLCSGQYNVSVTDANGCTLLGSGAVNPPPTIIINTHPHNVSCNGFSDGWISFTQQNAILPFSSLWMPGSIPYDTIKNLAVGTYNITITDNNGCTGNSNAVVGEPLPLIISIVTSPTSCPLSSDGIASTIPSGGTPQYTYNWTNLSGQVSAIVNNLAVGYYEVIVTDSHGCSAIAGKTVFSNDLFSVNAYGDTTIINGNNTTLGINLEQIGNYTYTWSPIEFTSYPYSYSTLVNPPTSTTFTITVIEDGSGCTGIDSVVVNVLPTTYLFIPNAFTPNNDGFNDLFQLIKGEIVKIEDVQIFNRWGQIVFRQPDLNWDGNNLDGKPCSFGVYAYYVVYSIEGNNSTYRKEGNVTLIR
ncbi:T9SS C-terminal target domain-containing protein [Bacteroidota bacterium]|nr:T9SS C-terminal target domain-containing protein [Bacteroidota bacterium]